MTIRRTARFIVTEDRTEEALRAIRVFVSHARSSRGTLMYESWQCADRATEFLRFMAFPDERAEDAHRTSDEVKDLTDVLYPLCTQRPRSTTGRRLGSSNEESAAGSPI
jgi:quinol monooxygenase YgiN